ncbi:MAG: hypothetical protein COT17_02945 [Elusimicrobia bacterium CG08_land_8_20_14_0_20_51_18]|nr:MAG: hypothetical protein COT17_02945 [Elusimicrobia bacterium CG08_land_8_20_14_0_20_51_18]
MTENEKLPPEKNGAAPKKSYKNHALVFLGIIALLVALGWTLPGLLGMREGAVEKYLMGGFAVFLAVFLFRLK